MGASFVLSWYSVAYSAVAPGGTSRSSAPRPARRRADVTDAPELDRALRERLQPRSWLLADTSRPATVGSFDRSPIRAGAVTARIDAGDHVIEAAWTGLGQPIVATGRVGTDAPWDTSTVLVGGRLVGHGGAPVAGRPFPNHVWDTWFGRPLSSALVAVAEVFREGAPTSRSSPSVRSR